MKYSLQNYTVHKFRHRSVVYLFVFLIVLDSCNTTPDSNTGAIATDTLSIVQGKGIFEKNCSACHNFRQDGIGPNLAGITNAAPVVWIKNFIKNPKEKMDAGDRRAQQLLEKYHTVMPSFSSLNEAELDKLVAFLHTQKATNTKTAADAAAIKNPVPEPIASSGIVAGLDLVGQIPHSGAELPFTRIAKLDYAQHNGGLFILDQRGTLYKLVRNKPVLYLNVAQWKPNFINAPGLATGFGSFAFHPQFVKNGLFYTSHTEAPHSKKADFTYPDSIKVTLQWVVTEWKAEQPGAIPFKGTSRELFRINMVSGIHGMQELTFNPFAKIGTEDYGLLYIGIGDGGAVENGYPFLTHHPDHLWGTIVRIDPTGKNSSNGQYGIPANNPFSNSTNNTAIRELYAYGFRNPNRITWTASGQMLATNIGQANIESVNRVQKGHDYGWPVREGMFAMNPSGNINNIYPLPFNDSVYKITYPLVQYDHDEGKAISGGFEYTGKSVPELRGKYVFGDVPTGRLFYVEMKGLKTGSPAVVKEWHLRYQGSPATLRSLCGNDRVDLHFGRDEQGEMYILTKPDGNVYKLVPERKK